MFKWPLGQIMVFGHTTLQTSALNRPGHAALPRHATSTWMAVASIMPVGASFVPFGFGDFSPSLPLLRKRQSPLMHSRR